MVGGAILFVVGVLLVLKARSVASALNELRAEKARRASFYSPESGERLRAMYRSPENQALQTRITLAVGVLFTVGGIGILVQALTK